MRLDDISIAYKRAKAEQIVTNLEQPINLHLLKLLGCEADETMRAHWKHELRTWLIWIAAIKIKPQNYSIQVKISSRTFKEICAMRLVDILAEQKLTEIAYSQKKAESFITGLERPLNSHLLKIWTIPDAPQMSHWVKEVLNWVDEIGEIILKPNNRRPPARFYFRILYDEPFGGTEVHNVTSRLKRLQRDGYVIGTNQSPLDLVNRLKAFHTALGERLAAGPISEAELLKLIGM